MTKRTDKEDNEEQERNELTRNENQDKRTTRNRNGTSSNICDGHSLFVWRLLYFIAARVMPVDEATILSYSDIFNSLSQIGPSSSCANCEAPSGKVALKLCSLCHISCYCDANCQLQHWPMHKLECIQYKYDNSLSQSRPSPSCANCEAPNGFTCESGQVVLKLCSICHLSPYCDANCQLQHWPMHKFECKKPEDRKPWFHQKFDNECPICFDVMAEAFATICCERSIHRACLSKCKRKCPFCSSAQTPSGIEGFEHRGFTPY